MYKYTYWQVLWWCPAASLLLFCNARAQCGFFENNCCVFAQSCCKVLACAMAIDFRLTNFLLTV